MAVLVVYIHSTDFPRIPDAMLMAVAGTAVPFFFMVSGFFYRGVVERGAERKQLLRTLRIFAIGLGLYMVPIAAKNLLVDGLSLFEYMGECFGNGRIWKVIFLNDNPWSIPLWYLQAFVYVLLIVKFLDTKTSKGRQVLYPLIPFLLVVNLLLAGYWNLFKELLTEVEAEPIDALWRRNWLFTGIPFFMIGDWIRNRGGRLVEWVGAHRTLAFGALGLSFLLGVVEQLVVYPPLGMCTITSALLIFLLAIVLPDCGDSNAVAIMGRKYSLVMYVTHSFIIMCYGYFLKIVGMVFGRDLSFLEILDFPAGVVGSLVLAILLGWVGNMRKRARA